jgi:hypothetical protein
MQKNQDRYHKIHLLSFGAGAAAYGLLATAVEDVRVAQMLDKICVVDVDRVTQNNTITCPDFAGYEGEWKASVLARLSMCWLKCAGVEVQPNMAIGIPSEVQAIDYASLLGECRLQAARNLTLAVICLDDWEARIHVERSLRKTALDCPNADIVVLQISLDRNLAQVRVHGTDYTNACQVCGLDTIPEPEPCVMFQRPALVEHGDRTKVPELVRGDLRAESRAAGRHACHVIAALAGMDFGSWIDTKTQIVLEGDPRTYAKTTSRKRMQAGCFGPHTPPDTAFDLTELVAEIG